MIEQQQQEVIVRITFESTADYSLLTSGMPSQCE